MQEMKENFLRGNANILGEEVCCMLRNIFRGCKVCLGLGGWYFCSSMKQAKLNSRRETGCEFSADAGLRTVMTL
jgi:hypothetical protein